MPKVCVCFCFVLFFPPNLSSSRRKPSRFILTNEKQSEGWAGDVVDTFTTHASLVYDVTDTDCRAQNGSTHGRVFCDFQTSLFNKREEEIE